METEASPHYMRVAICIANSIVRGTHIVGEKLSGQSTLSTEYGVSPETIRRAMCLLADMKIVESKKHSGTFVLSVDNAARFLEEYRDKKDISDKKHILQGLLNQQASISKMVESLCTEIIFEKENSVQVSNEIPTYEVKVPEGSWIVGKSLVKVRFWTNTEATVVAIRRSGHLILSPGPTAEMFDGDRIIFTGKPETVEKVKAFLRNEEILS